MPTQRPSGRTPTPVPKLVSSRMPQQAQQTPQAQGRAVVNQGGRQGVVGRGGNFQALGDAALSKLPAPAPAPAAMPQPKLMPSVPMFPGGRSDQLSDYMNAANAGNGPGGPMTGGGPWPDAGRSLPANGFIGGRSSYGGGGGDIESAISSLRGQLGMPPGSDAALAAGGGPGPAPGIAARLAGRMPMPQQPQPGQQPQANDLMAKFGAGRPNPYAEILRQRMNPAAGGGLAGMGGGQLQRQYAY